MIMRRTTFFFSLIIIVITPFLLYKILWLLHSEKTIGRTGFVGKSYTGQIAHVYSVIRFMAGHDTIWFNSNDNILYQPGQIVPVRYQSAHPSEARVNIFVSIWGDTVVYGGIPVLILLVMFLHPELVPRRSRLRLQA